MYSVVGDSEFKRKFLGDTCSTLEIHSDNKPFANKSMKTSHLQSTKDKLNVTTTISRDTIMSKLTLDQQLRATRDFRSFMRFKAQKEDWRSVDKKLMKIMHKDSTVMNDSFKDLYAHPNPEKQ